MTVHERHVDIKADPDALFALLATPRRMPEYIDYVTAAETGDDGLVRIFATAGGRLFEVVARITFEPVRRRLTWTAEGAEHRGGELEVTAGRTPGTSVVTARVVERDDLPGDHVREAVGFGLGHGRTHREHPENPGALLERYLDNLRVFAETGQRAAGRYR